MVARLAITLSTFVVSSLVAAPVYSIFQGQQFMQAGDVVLTQTRAAYWECAVHGLLPIQVSSVKVSSPLGNSVSLNFDASKDNAVVTRGYPADSARGAVFPSGSYTLRETRTDSSVVTVTLTQSTAAYPAVSRFISLDSLPIAAGRDLRLDWEKSSDATADDFVVLKASGVNSRSFETWELNTPWPGQPDALSGLATSTTVPGDLIKPNDIITLVLTRFRINDRQTTSNGLTLSGSATAIAATISVPDQPEGNDVAQYRLLAARVLRQDSPSTLIVPDRGGFLFEASAWAVSQERLTNVTLGLPAGGNLQLQPSEDQISWQTNLVFNTEEQLGTVLPPGTYYWTFTGAGAGIQRATTTAGQADSWPTPLSVGNWSGLQTNSFTNDAVVHWTTPSGALPSDRIELIVAGPDGAMVYRNPDFSKGDPPIPGTDTQLTIRAKKLIDGVDYEGRLRYIHYLAEDTHSLSGATGWVARCVETRFPLGSRVAFPLEVLTSDLPAGEVGSRYSVQLLGNRGRRPYSWSATAGSLPQGLRLNTNGVISGVPAAKGTYPIVITATDAIGQNTGKAMRLDIVGELKPLEIASSALPRLVAGIYYFAELTIRGGVEPYQWSIASGRLPAGLELQGCCGIIAGDPVESGEFAFELRLQDGAGQVQQRAFALSVPPEALAPPLKINACSSRGEGDLTLALTGQEGDPITVQSSDDLSFWSNVLSTNLPKDGTVRLVAPPGERKFFRARFGHDRPNPNPVLVRPALAANRFVEELTYTNPVSLSLTNDSGIVLQLDVPANALAQPERIRMSLVQGIADLPLNSLLWAVEFQPDGLSLLQQGTLTVTFPAGIPADAVSFAYGTEGRDCHLNPALSLNGKVVLPIQHFSGAGQGQGTKKQAADLSNRPPCLPMYAGEAEVAAILQDTYPAPAPPELLQAVMKQWFDQSVLPNLKKAEKDDASLDAATTEFLRWSYLNRLLCLGDWNETGRQSLARGMANAINKSQARCASNFDPGEMAVMIGRDRQALLLGLEQYLPDAFDSPKVLDRVSRCLQFELKLDSIIDVPGKWVEQVRSAPLRFRWRKEDIAEDGMYVRAEGSANLDLVSWDFYNERVRPSTAGGSFKGMWLKLTMPPQEKGSPPDPENPCPAPPSSKPPSAVGCFFKADDPINGMYVRDVNGTWWFESIPVDAGGRWGSLFKEAHLQDWVGLPDLDGNEMTGFYFRDWEVSGGQVFATKEFTGSVETSGGRAVETTYLELRHTPQPSTAP